MDELYQLIVAELKKVPGIKWIDFDYGQLENENLGLKFPCGLIKLSSNNHDIDESGTQQKNPTVQLRLAWDAIGSRTSADTPGSVLTRSLAWADVAAEVYDLLQGETFGNFEALECTSEGQETRNDGLVVYQYTFITGALKFK